MILQLLLATFFGVIAAFNGIDWKKATRVKKSCAIASALLAVVIGYNAYQKYQEEEILKKVAKTFGEIEDFNGAAKPVIRLGHSVRDITFQNSSGFVDEFNEGKLKVTVNNNKLFVTAIIRGLDGHLIAVIDKNKWELIDNSLVDYNNNDTSFEVVSKGLHKVYFQVELSQGMAYVTGLFVSKKGRGMYVSSDDKNIDDGLFQKITDPETFEIPETVYPIFKYPRSEFFGQRE